MADRRQSGRSSASEKGRASGANRSVGAGRASGADRPSGANRSVGAGRASGADRPSGGDRPSAADRSSAKNHNSRTPTPDEQIRALYEQAESNTAKAFEEYVSKPSFGWLMARSAENVAALSRIGSEFTDLVWRNLRIAGRADVTRLARQLHRTEDKLERVLQEVEQLRDELAARTGQRTDGADPEAGKQRKARS